MSVADEATPIRHIKKPDEVWGKGLDFSDALGSATISTTNISAIDLSDNQSANVATDGGNKDGVVTVVLSGGQVGHKYQVTCQITTSAGEVYEKDIIMSVVSVI